MGCCGWLAVSRVCDLNSGFIILFFLGGGFNLLHCLGMLSSDWVI